MIKKSHYMIGSGWWCADLSDPKTYQKGNDLALLADFHHACQSSLFTLKVNRWFSRRMRCYDLADVLKQKHLINLFN